MKRNSCVLIQLLEYQALVAQRIEHLTTDQKVRGSNPFGRTKVFYGNFVEYGVNYRLDTLDYLNGGFEKCSLSLDLILHG